MITVPLPFPLCLRMDIFLMLEVWEAQQSWRTGADIGCRTNTLPYEFLMEWTCQEVSLSASSLTCLGFATCLGDKPFYGTELAFPLFLLFIFTSTSFYFLTLTLQWMLMVIAWTFSSKVRGQCFLVFHLSPPSPEKLRLAMRGGALDQHESIHVESRCCLGEESLVRVVFVDVCLCTLQRPIWGCTHAKGQAIGQRK